MQPYCPEVPSPYSQVGSGVYLLTDSSGCTYQFFFPVMDICCRYCHYMESCFTNHEIWYDLYRRISISQYLI